MHRAAAILALSVIPLVPGPVELLAQDSTSARADTTALAPVVAVQTAGPQPIGLNDAVGRAQRYSPLAVQARGQLRNAGAQRIAAYAAFLPSITINAQRSYASGSFLGEGGQIIRFAGTPYSSSDGLNAQLVLFDGGRRLFDIRNARAAGDLASANEITQRYTIALNVKQAFFNVLAARELEGAALAQLEQAERNLLVASARVEAGAAIRSDSLRAALQVQNARLAIVTARNQLRSANASLTRQVGSEQEVTADPADTADVAALQLDSTQLARLAAEGPVLDQAVASRNAAKAQLRSAWSDYLPNVTLGFNRSGTGFDGKFGQGDPWAYFSSANITASFPVFTRFTREQQRVQADVTADNAEAQLRDTRLLVRQQLAQFLGDYQAAEQQIAIQEVAVATADADLQQLQERYRVGASTQLDLLTSQTALFQARAALIQARYNQRVARANIEALVGRDLR
ncbi:MAG: TolC family protein [Gemmatimonadaceae bacterium]